MLKREITYEDFNDQTVTETFYFNISKPELIELEVEHPKGFGAWLEEIMAANDQQVLMGLFKRIVLLAYGQKSEDGKRFIKSDELRSEFEQTAAYISLFTELATEAGKAADFINGIMPKDMVADIAKATAAVTAPTPPTS